MPTEGFLHVLALGGFVRRIHGLFLFLERDNAVSVERFTPGLHRESAFCFGLVNGAWGYGRANEKIHQGLCFSESWEKEFLMEEAMLAQFPRGVKSSVSSRYVEVC